MLKKLIVILVLLSPQSAFSQDIMGIVNGLLTPAAPSESTKSEAMDLGSQIREVMLCMNEVDITQLKPLEERGKAIQKKIKDLCAKGRKMQADHYAKMEGRRFMRDPTIKNLQACSKSLSKHLTEFLSWDEKNMSVCE